jgi:DNA-binding beta-propeller fold protein YncE
VDASDSRIQKFSSEGKFVKQWDIPIPTGNRQRVEPTTIAFDPNDRLFVPDMRNQQVLIYSTEGQLLGQWKEWSGGRFSRPAGVAVDKDGCVYVTDLGNHAVYKFKVRF